MLSYDYTGTSRRAVDKYRLASFYVHSHQAAFLLWVSLKVHQDSISRYILSPALKYLFATLPITFSFFCQCLFRAKQDTSTARVANIFKYYQFFFYIGKSIKLAKFNTPSASAA